MKVLLSICIGVLGFQPAFAQTVQTPVIAHPYVGTENYAALNNFDTDRRTPTMQREQLSRALALRDEAAELARSNGGQLSTDQERYIRRKVCAILNPNASRTGSLAPDTTRACLG